MKKRRIVHILFPDLFTESFVELVNKEFNSDEHFFLFCSKPDERLLLTSDNIAYLKNPYTKNIFGNSIKFYSNIFTARKIILHGIPVLFYLFIIPWKWRKLYWIIQGYEIPDGKVGDERFELSILQRFIENFILKRVSVHISHIEGDSEFANARYGSKARFCYSPVYLSNVVAEVDGGINRPEKHDDIKVIMVGNSASPTNNHLSIFEMLLPYKDTNVLIYCPLAYGNYPDYKEYVIRKGQELFKEKFNPLTEFMDFHKYLALLANIDIAIFNHQRQEAMGVTLQLINLGKVVYMNKSTSSFKSFTKRGIQVFDNELIMQGGLLTSRDVLSNPDLVKTHYSYDVLIKSLSSVFNNPEY